MELKDVTNNATAKEQTNNYALMAEMLADNLQDYKKRLNELNIENLNVDQAQALIYRAARLLTDEN